MIAGLFALLIVVWALSILLLTLHYGHPRFGFAPLLLMIGALTAFTQSQLGIYVEPFPGFLMFISSNGLVPILLMAVLVIYVADGAVPARLTIFGVLGVSLLVLALMLAYQLIVSLPGSGSFSGLELNELIRPINPRTTLASLAAFVADMFAIAVSYQGVKNTFRWLPEWIVVGIALLAGLWTDAILFRILADLGTADFLALLPGDVFGKTVSALILWPAVGLYLARLAPLLPDYQGRAHRRTFDVFRGSFNDVQVALVRTEAALKRAEQAREREAEKVALLRNFINEASHDLRTPLTAINLKIHALSKTEDPAKRGAYLEELRQQSSRLNAMINDVFTLARLENMAEMTLANASVNGIVEEVCSTAQPIAAQKQQRLTLDLTPKETSIFTDREDLTRALANLVNNAVNYTPPGGRIDVATHRQNGELTVQVSDTGIGIPPEDLPHVFERFFRASNARDTDPGGTGLGLAIARSVVEKHGGRIEVTSEVGKGTTFRVFLPLLKFSAPKPAER